MCLQVKKTPPPQKHKKYPTTTQAAIIKTPCQHTAFLLKRCLLISITNDTHRSLKANVLCKSNLLAFRPELERKLLDPTASGLL